MPRYIAILEVELDEPTIAGAMETARSLATLICNESFTTDCARATGLQTTGEFDRELYEVDPSFSIVADRIVCDGELFCEATAEFEGTHVRESGHTSLVRVCSGHKSLLGDRPRKILKV